MKQKNLDRVKDALLKSYIYFLYLGYQSFYFVEWLLQRAAHISNVCGIKLECEHDKLNAANGLSEVDHTDHVKPPPMPMERGKDALYDIDDTSDMPIRKEPSTDNATQSDKREGVTPQHCMNDAPEPQKPNGND